MVIISSIVLVGALCKPANTHRQMKREEFAAQMALVRQLDSKENVRKLLGAPEEIWRNPAQGPFLFGDRFTLEGWVYGLVRPGGFPTLGRVYFDRAGLVRYAYGGSKPSVLALDSENWLPLQMQNIADSPGLFAAQYRCRSMEAAANKMISLGKVRAIYAMREFIRVSPHSSVYSSDGIRVRSGPSRDDTFENVYLLLRAIFDLKSRPFPYIGSIDYVSPQWKALESMYPRFPLVVFHGTPFLFPTTMITPFEPSDRKIDVHLDYFERWGILRRPYRIVPWTMSLGKAISVIRQLHPKPDRQRSSAVARTLSDESVQ